MSNSTRRRLEVLTKDPLSDLARKKRQFLLGISILGILIVWAGLVPRELPFFGLKLSSEDQEGLRWLVLVINVYYLVVFCIYCIIDLFKLVHEYFSVEDTVNDRAGQNVTNERSRIGTVEIGGREFSILRVIWNVHSLRILIESLLPVLLGLFSVISLLSVLL